MSETPLKDTLETPRIAEPGAEKERARARARERERERETWCKAYQYLGPMNAIKHTGLRLVPTQPNSPQGSRIRR